MSMGSMLGGRVRTIARAAVVAALSSAVVGGLGAIGSALGGCAAARKPDPSMRALAPEERSKYVESFDVVWTTIKDKHWDPKLNGADWDGARAELRPKIEAARTPGEARGVLNELISRLGQSHFGVIPADVYATDPGAPAKASAAGSDASGGKAEAKKDGPSKDAKGDGPENGQTGLDLRVIAGKVTVFRVEEGSPAAAAGIAPGWIVAKVDGTDLSSRVAMVTASRDAAEQKEGGRHLGEDLIAREIVGSFLRGRVGETRVLELLDGTDRPAKRDLVLAEPRGTRGDFGNLTSIWVRYDARRIGSGAQSVGYFAFNIFADPTTIVSEFGRTVEASRDAAGLVIDLRGNPGGVGAMAMGMGNWFVAQKDQKLGTMITRDSKVNFVLRPRPRAYDKPVAILVDGSSASTSEIFAGGLQDLKAARVFGTTSAGAALPSVISVLPSGDRFQYAFANYVSAGGSALEGRGVVPDEVVPLDRASLLRGEDPQLEAALRWVRSGGSARAER